LAWLSVILSDPTTAFTVRVFPVLIPETFEKKSYLVLVPLLINFFDVRLFLYFQKFLALLGLYFSKEWMLPLLSMLLAAVDLRVSFFTSSFFEIFTAFFILAFF
jgi:hypothetical protein